MYEANLAVDKGASAILAGPVSTNAAGHYSFPQKISCLPAGAPVYVVARGGHLQGDSNNSSLVLSSTVGTCNALGSVAPVQIDEISTIATIWPMANFLGAYDALGATPQNASQLESLFNQALQLLATLRFADNHFTAQPTYIQEGINSLSNLIAVCVNTSSVSSAISTTCSNLLGLASVLSNQPVSNTADAAIAIANNPLSQVDKVFSLSSSVHILTPALTSAPANWALSTLLNGELSFSDASVQPQASIPPGSSFTPPAVNACQSPYDQFQESEPGVYAYWPLCESGSPAQIFDYAGTFDLTKKSSAFGAGTVSGGAPGPVADGETAATVQSAAQTIENQGIPVNRQQGTLAAWIKGNAQGYPISLLGLASVGGKSAISINFVAQSGKLCILGRYINAQGLLTSDESCGYAPDVWYRAVVTWSSGTLNLYIDGDLTESGSYSGMVDDGIYYYRLFSGCCSVSYPLYMAKASVASSAWTAAQVAADYSPSLPQIPSGGIFVTTDQLGEIHKDVLGYADYNQNISSSSLTQSLLGGLQAGGFTAVRYAGGGGGITSDLIDWSSGEECIPSKPQQATSPVNSKTGNTIANYLHGVAQSLGLDVVYTVNYGTNAPYCDGGGDPVSNGADLVSYLNVNMQQHVQYFEIGNEIYSANSETDYHPDPNTGASYAHYEPAFYTAMKSVDPSIQIAVPISISDYQSAVNFSYPVLNDSLYDAIVWHSYPLRDPIDDGDTLYTDRVASSGLRPSGELRALETVLINHKKAPDAIWVTEWNGEYFGDKWSQQTMGAAEPLFVTMQIANYMNAGVRIANWWTQGGTDVCSTLNYDSSGSTSYAWWACGDGSPVYTGAIKGVGEMAVGLQPGDLTPTGHAFQLLSESGFVTEGEHMLQPYVDYSSSPWLAAYAATHGSSYAVILVNRDRDNAHTVPVELSGQVLGLGATQWTYGRVQYDEVRHGNWRATPTVQQYGPWVGTFYATLPPWSASVIVFK